MTRPPATPPPGRRRKHRPLVVDIAACLYRLGIDPNETWEMQHEPPLALRPFDPVTNDYDPPENDYRHLVPMQKAVHAQVTKEVDRPAIDKTRRVAKKHAKHARAMDLWPFANDGRERPSGFASNFGRNYVNNGEESGSPRKHVDVDADKLVRSKRTAIGRKMHWWPKGRKIRSRGFQKRPKQK